MGFANPSATDFLSQSLIKFNFKYFAEELKEYTNLVYIHPGLNVANPQCFSSYIHGLSIYNYIRNFIDIYFSCEYFIKYGPTQSTAALATASLADTKLTAKNQEIQYEINLFGFRMNLAGSDFNKLNTIALIVIQYTSIVITYVFTLDLLNSTI